MASTLKRVRLPTGHALTGSWNRAIDSTFVVLAEQIRQLKRELEECTESNTRLCDFISTASDLLWAIEALGRDPATDPAMAEDVEAIRQRRPYRGFEYSLPLSQTRRATIAHEAA